MISKFRHDKHASVYAWIIILIFMFTYAVIWFTAGWAAMRVVETTEEQYAFEDRADGVIDLLKNVFAWHPIIVFIGLLLYGFVSSQKKDVRFDV